LEFGGTQRYAVQLLGHLDRATFSPELWILRRGDAMLAMAREAGCAIRRMSEDSWVSPAAILNLAVHLRRRRPQILYTLTAVPNIWGRVLGRLARVPVVVSGYRSLLPRQHERRLWSWSDRIICNAQALKRIMTDRLGVDPMRIAVIPNGVDASHFVPWRQGQAREPTVLFLGRLVQDKDPSTLLEAFALVARKIPQARLQIVGDGVLGGLVRRTVNRLHLAGRVHLLPGSVDPRVHLGRAWLLAVSSIREASPHVILEAMAMGIPVAATRVGGIPELVKDGATGLLVPPGDPKALGAAMAGLLGDEARRRFMGEKARARAVSRFTLDRMAGLTGRVLLEAWEDRRGRRTPRGSVGPISGRPLRTRPGP
jgi:glycosyltransferase involved in cell wall biosynthesis